MPASLAPFQAFVDEHATSVAAFLRGMLGAVDAEDALQETFLAALRAYPRFDGANARGWVMAIAHRKAIDAHRSRSKRPQPLADPDTIAAEPVAGMSDCDAAIWWEVAQLPAKQRAAVVLRFAVDLRYREVGEALGCSEEAARRSVHEAMRTLRAAPSMERSAA